MANQPNRQQPFRFWFPGWTNPPPRRTPTTQGRSQTRTPVTPSQPEAPLSQPPKQQPQKPTPSSQSTAQAPTNPTQPSPIAQETPRTPSSSPSSPPSPSKPEPKRQPTLPSQVGSQPSSPSKTEPKRQSTLPSQGSQPPPPSKPEPGRQSTLPSQVASRPSIPSPSEPAQKSQAPSPSRAAQPQPPGKPGSPPSPRSQGKPEPKRQATLPSQVASQPSSPSPDEPDQKPQPPPPSSKPEQKPQPPSSSELEKNQQPPSPSSEPEQKLQPSLPSQGISLPQPVTPGEARLQSPSPPTTLLTKLPSPSPSSETEQKLQPSLPSQGISLPQPVTLGEARLPSPSPPTTLLTKPLPQEPQTALDSSSPTVPTPETQLQNTSKAQESVPEPTTQLTESTQHTESGNQISQKLKTNQIPTDSLMKDVSGKTTLKNPNKPLHESQPQENQIPTDSPMKDVSGKTTLKNPNKPLHESQPQEIKEKPVMNPEQKQENKPDPEEGTNSEVEVNREKMSSVPENNHTVRKAKEKQEMLPTETLKPQNPSEETKEKYERRADLKQNINPEKTSETEPISELIKKYNHLTKPEAHLNKPRDRASEESETKIKPRIAIQVADSRPNTRDHTSEIKMSKPEQIMQGNVNVEEKLPENGNGASSRESRIAISTIPKRVFTEGEQADFQKEIKEGLSKLVQKLSTGQHPGGDQGVTIITLAGENKGATMILDSDEGSMQSNRGFKLSDKVGATRDNHVDQSDRADNTNPGITTSVNSNVQNINNSLLQDSSCSEGDPGVHLIVSSKPKEPVYLIRKKEMLPSQKTNSSTLQPQKYTYETNVRRRCLRGLLLESSESDPDNPNKPRRHGCRVTCDDKKKGKAEDEGASASHGNIKGKHEEMF